MLFLRLRLVVKDRDGREVSVNFHTDDRGASFAQHSQKGSTLAILYGQQHGFMDGSIGIRVEMSEFVKVLPFSMEELLEASDYLSKDGRKEKCGNCEAKGSQTEGGLKMCSRCKEASYCGRECQKKAWAKEHKRVCKAVKALDCLTSKAWDTFEGWFRF
ncbi:hypothetical protein EW146_g1318 [Bondarzewia mesenterica]|uniref:MYND-type domain-containing protein n=1 Tax=Bondarzewia mesenterica TaxID=1095465 RepID=A0A4S4M628_9AGAM|nr:hypothetical protein EW146_g1318 [Bondarzewia mesenterica]